MKNENYKCINPECQKVQNLILMDDKPAFPKYIDCKCCESKAIRIWGKPAVHVMLGKCGNSTNGYTSSPVYIKKTGKWIKVLTNIMQINKVFNYELLSNIYFIYFWFWSVLMLILTRKISYLFLNSLEIGSFFINIHKKYLLTLNSWLISTFLSDLQSCSEITQPIESL